MPTEQPADNGAQEQEKRGLQALLLCSFHLSDRWPGHSRRRHQTTVPECTVYAAL